MIDNILSAMFFNAELKTLLQLVEGCEKGDEKIQKLAARALEQRMRHIQKRKDAIEDNKEMKEVLEDLNKELKDIYKES